MLFRSDPERLHNLRMTFPAVEQVLFLDAGGLPCDVDPALPMPVRGLRAEVAP